MAISVYRNYRKIPVSSNPLNKMTTTFYSIIPNHESLLALEPEELAGVVLAVMHSEDESRKGKHNRYNLSLGHSYSQYPREHWKKIGQAIMEAWVWLEREGLVAPLPGEQNEWFFITRRGKQIKGLEDLKAYRRADLLPHRQLHPTIAQKVWAMFLRGDYDTAVFQAFKEVEVAIRQAGNFSDSDLGRDLMCKAFKPTSGPLSNKSADKGEQESLMLLFSGAIGSYKNPHSHRNVQVEADEAVEMIILASHLLKIVDDRINKINS
jgi:uncharacterized protein (TIGR02391 family)